MHYIYLILAWLVFGLLHSMLASGAVKRAAFQKMKSYYQFYRLSYSVFATVGLLIVMRFHFLCVGPILWNPPLIEGIFALFMAIAGLLVMAICIANYFPNLSGIDVILGTVGPAVLKQDGLHAYVRHPLYSATLAFAWALFMAYPYLNNLISCICITLYTLVGIFFEEKKLVGEFGETYRQYQAKVPPLLPVRIFN